MISYGASACAEVQQQPARVNRRHAAALGQRGAAQHKVVADTDQRASAFDTWSAHVRYFLARYPLDSRQFVAQRLATYGIRSLLSSHRQEDLTLDLLASATDAADRDVLAMMKEHARRRRGNAQQLAQRGSSQAVRPGAASLGPRGDAVRRADSAFKNHPVTFQSTAPATAAGVLREREENAGTTRGVPMPVTMRVSKTKHHQVAARPNVLKRYPFVDDLAGAQGKGVEGALCQATPDTPIQDLAKREIRRLAHEVFCELKASALGIRLSDLPSALQFLFFGDSASLLTARGGGGGNGPGSQPRANSGRTAKDVHLVMALAREALPPTFAIAARDTSTLSSVSTHDEAGGSWTESQQTMFISESRWIKVVAHVVRRLWEMDGTLAMRSNGNILAKKPATTSAAAAAATVPPHATAVLQQPLRREVANGAGGVGRIGAATRHIAAKTTDHRRLRDGEYPDGGVDVRDDSLMASSLGLGFTLTHPADGGAIANGRSDVDSIASTSEFELEAADEPVWTAAVGGTTRLSSPLPLGMSGLAASEGGGDEQMNGGGGAPDVEEELLQAWELAGERIATGEASLSLAWSKDDGTIGPMDALLDESAGGVGQGDMRQQGAAAASESAPEKNQQRSTKVGDRTATATVSRRRGRRDIGLGGRGGGMSGAVGAAEKPGSRPAGMWEVTPPSHVLAMRSRGRRQGTATAARGNGRGAGVPAYLRNVQSKIGAEVDAHRERAKKIAKARNSAVRDAVARRRLDELEGRTPSRTRASGESLGSGGKRPNESLDKSAPSRGHSAGEHALDIAESFLESSLMTRLAGGDWFDMDEGEPGSAGFSSAWEPERGVKAYRSQATGVGSSRLGIGGEEQRLGRQELNQISARSGKADVSRRRHTGWLGDYGPPHTHAIREGVYDDDFINEDKAEDERKEISQDGRPLDARDELENFVRSGAREMQHVDSKKEDRPDIDLILEDPRMFVGRQRRGGASTGTSPGSREGDHREPGRAIDEDLSSRSYPYEERPQDAKTNAPRRPVGTSSLGSSSGVLDSRHGYVSPRSEIASFHESATTAAAINTVKAAEGRGTPLDGSAQPSLAEADSDHGATTSLDIDLDAYLDLAMNVSCDDDVTGESGLSTPQSEDARTSSHKHAGGGERIEGSRDGVAGHHAALTSPKLWQDGKSAILESAEAIDAVDITDITDEGRRAAAESAGEED